MGSFDRGDVSAAGTPSQAQTVYAGESYFAEHAGNVSASQQPQQQAHDDLDELAEESEDEEARLSGRGEQREQVREESSSLPAPRQQPAAGTDALSHDEPRGSGHANNEHEDGDGTMSMEMTRPYHSSSPSKSLAAMGNSSTHASDSQKENASSAPAPSAEHKRKGKGKQVQQEALAAPSSSFDEVSLIPAKSAARAAQQQHKHRSQPPPQASGNTSIIEVSLHACYCCDGKRSDASLDSTRHASSRGRPVRVVAVAQRFTSCHKPNTKLQGAPSRDSRAP